MGGHWQRGHRHTQGQVHTSNFTPPPPPPRATPTPLTHTAVSPLSTPLTAALPPATIPLTAVLPPSTLTLTAVFPSTPPHRCPPCPPTPNPRSFDDVHIGSDGTVPFRSGERISFTYLISQKYTGTRWVGWGGIGGVGWQRTSFSCLIRQKYTGDEVGW